MGSSGGVGLARAPWGSLCLCEVAWFTCVCPEGLWVHPRSFGYFACALESLGLSGVVGSLGCVMGVVGFIQCHWVHWGASSGSLGSSRVVGLSRVGYGFIQGH